MPNYTFRCTKDECSHEFTIEKSINDQSEILCPKCNYSVKRIYKSNINLNFRGSYNSTRK